MAVTNHPRTYQSSASVAAGSVLALAVLLVLELLIWRSGWFQRAFPATDPLVAPRYGQRLAMIADRHPSIVFVGNSRMLQGLRPVLFDRLVGSHQRTANVAISGAPVYIWYLFTKRLSELPPELRPKAVIVGLTATDLLVDEIRPEPPDLYGLLNWPEDALPADVGWANSLDWGLGSIWHLWRNRAICRKILEDKLQAVMRPRRVSADVPTPGSREDAADPIWQSESAFGFQPDFGRAGVSLPPVRDWPVHRSLPQARWLTKLVACCQHQGMGVHVLVLPQYGRFLPDGAHGAMMAELRRLPVDGVTDYSTIRWAARDWRDNEHLAPSGATQLTQRVAADLKSWLGHAVP